VAGVSTLLISDPAEAQATDPVGLGTAADFSVLAASTVTNTGPSVLAQSLGVHPGNAAPGFPPGTVGGETHLGDAVALQAQDDLTTAYNDAAGRTPFTNLPAELGGTTLIPGVYRIGAAQLTGTLTLNAQGNPDSVFIFQVDSTLITASDSSVEFINGSAACNVYWQVGSSATLGTNTSFVGTIMAQASVTMNTGADLEGRALARTAAVTLDTNVITEPLCAAPPPPPTSPPPPPTSPPPPPPPPPGPGEGPGPDGSEAEVDDLEPRRGPTSGGTRVAITGSGFAGATGVTFDGVAGTDFTVDAADETITVVTPANAAGTVDVAIVFPAGTVFAGTFTYVGATLPNTGSGPWPLLAIGSGLLLGGAGLVALVARRRWPWSSWPVR
jgi:type VI secretion system secreted protein VgrG